MRETVRLGEVGSFVSGGTPSRKHPEYFEGTIPWVSTPALNGGLLDETDAVQLITEDAVANSATKLLPPHSLLIGIRVGVGKTAVNTVPMCTNQDIVAITDIDETRWDIQYLCYAIQAKSAYLVSQKQGATITGITSKLLKSLEVRWLDLEAQSRCVFNLDNVRGKIEDCKTLLEKLDELVKSRFVEMFGNPTLKRDGWDFLKIGDGCEVITGNTPSRKNPANYGDYIEWIKSDNIGNGTYLTQAREYLSEAGVTVGRCAPSGSILMACIAGSIKSIGKVAIANRPVAFNQQINAIVPGDKLDTVYLFWAFRLSKDYLCSGVNMQLKGILNKTTLSSKKYLVPPLALQQEFAAFVEQVDKLACETRQAIEKLHTLYDSLAQEYFGS